LKISREALVRELFSQTIKSTFANSFQAASAGILEAERALTMDINLIRRAVASDRYEISQHAERERRCGS